MVDIRLITVLQTPAVQGATQVPSTQTGSPTIQINLPTGSILSGFIVNRDPAGNPILRTETSDVVFASNFFLKIGSEVVIRVENRAGQQQARILTVNGQPPEIAEGQSAFANDPEVIVGQSQGQTPRANAPATTDSITRSPISVTVSGTVVATPLAETEATATPLPPGTQIALKVVTVTAPTQTANPALPAELPASPNLQPGQAQTQPQTATLNAYSAYVRTTAAPQTPAQNNNPAAPIPVAQVATQQNIPQGSAPQIGAAITATVISNDPAGEALLQTPVGVIRLQPGAVLPAGSKVTFEITNLLAPDAKEILPAQLAPLTELAREWTSIKQIFSLISAYNLSADAASPLHLPALLTPNSSGPQSLPSPQNMTAGLMMFIAALRGGDFRSWLGKENVDWLSKGGHDALIRKAEGEFISMVRPFTEQPAHQWQALFFPFAAGGELQQVRMFTKRDKKQNKNDPTKNDEDTRFIVEIELTQMGEMQMDGFVRKQDKSVEFDLVIRSHNQLDPEIERDIHAIYNNIGELTGYRGQIQFQSVREFPTHPMEELTKEHLKDVIV